MSELPTGQMHSNFFTALPGPAAGREATFSEPWMARAFGVTLALAERELFTLKDFQAALIDAIGRHETTDCIGDDAEYYTHWLEALQALLRRRSLAPEAMISDQAISSLERTLVADATARKEHQHHLARNADGSLKIAPIVVA